MLKLAFLEHHSRENVLSDIEDDAEGGPRTSSGEGHSPTRFVMWKCRIL